VPTFKYRGVLARQSAAHRAITISARASDVFAFASISRAGRDVAGALQGFQRPQIAAHVREIRDYLRTKDSVLPNSIVVGFVEGVQLRELSHNIAELTITTDHETLGYVIDGQQRLAALSSLPEKDFELFVSVLVCRDVEELRRQFILLNSTRPLPKALIYELLPGTTGLPNRLTSRSFAAALTERLNFDPSSSLKGKIYQYTNPTGVIRDTSIQKVIMHSVSDGAIREMSEKKQFSGGFALLSEFFAAVKEVFVEEWEGHTPKTSRLVHGAGIQALGFVMELLVGRDGAQTRKEFARGLASLKGRTAWTSGSWKFSESEQLPWNRLENTHRQIVALAHYLVTVVRSDPRREFKLEPVPSNEGRAARRASA
jgi:DGQHR domain-containing protein